jgi:IS30 family transposase
MAENAAFTIKTGMPVYLCDRQCGTNENSNGLLRQYFSKGTDLSGYTQAQLNDRPQNTRMAQAPPKYSSCC